MTSDLQDVPPGHEPFGSKLLPRCGDTVKHRPTGETWEVAYAHGNDLAWFGWPDGLARVSDCEIVQRCSDEEHLAAVARWLDREHRRDERGCMDSRVGWIRRLYRPEEEARLVRETLNRDVLSMADRVRMHSQPLADAMAQFAGGAS